MAKAIAMGRSSGFPPRNAKYKTDQEKYEGSDSTFISLKYVQTIESKPVSEWIIAVGRHEGFISSEQWIEVQELLDAIAEKYNRPHRKTNTLLAGLVIVLTAADD